MKKFLAVLMSSGLLVLLQGCGSSAATTLTCSATASVVSGDVNAANAAVTMNNLIVTILNGTGPYTIVVPGGATTSSSAASYTYPSNFSVTTGASGGVSAPVSVTDTSNKAVASCTVTAGSTGTTSTTLGVSVTASPSTSAAIGQAITLTSVSTNGVASPTFTYSLSTPTTGVTLSQLSTTQATVSSTVAATVTVSVTEYTSGSTVSSGSATITLTFGSGGSTGTTGNINITATPSTSTSVGGSISLYATDMVGAVNPSFVFSPPNVAGVTMTGNGTYATVTSSIATTVTINVTEYANGTTVAANGSITLYFGTSGNGGTLSCWLYGIATQTSYPYFYIQVGVGSSTNEAITVTQIYSNGQATNVTPSNPTAAPFTLQFLMATTTYQATIEVWAQSASRPGVLCNGGAGMFGNVNVP